MTMFNRRSYMREYMRRRRRLLPRARTSLYRPGQNPASVAARFKLGHPYVGPELTAEHRRELAARALGWATPERRERLRELALAWWTPERRAARAAEIRDRAACRRAESTVDAQDARGRVRGPGDSQVSGGPDEAVQGYVACACGPGGE